MSRRRRAARALSPARGCSETAKILGEARSICGVVKRYRCRAPPCEGGTRAASVCLGLGYFLGFQHRTEQCLRLLCARHGDFLIEDEKRHAFDAEVARVLLF